MSRTHRLIAPLVLMGAVTVACAGFLAVGPHVGHSLTWNVNWSRGFAEALRAGEWYPRWMPAMEMGAGSPIFFYYGSIPFYATAVPYLLCGSCDDLVALGIGEWLIVLASALAFYAFARRHAGPAAAAGAALVYALLPYHFAIDLTVRQAVGETAAYVWMPLALLAVDRMASGQRGVVGLGVAYALLTMTHLPATVLFSPFLVAYGAVWAWAGRSTTVLARTVAGVALGVLLAAVYLVPALFLQDAISPQFLWDEQYDPRRWLFGSGAPPKIWFSLRLLYVFLTTTVPWLVCWPLAYRASRDGDRVRAVAWLLFVGGAWFLMTIVSAPLWSALPVLQKVQFPWRVGIVLDLAVAATAVLVFKGIDLGARRVRAIVMIVLVALPVVGTLVFGTQWARWDLSRRASYRAKTARLVALAAGPPEYFTPRATESPLAVRAALAAAPELVDTRGGGQLTVLGRTPRRIALRASLARSTDVVVRQFYFPGWVARAPGWPAPVRAEPSSPLGLLVFSLPAGAYDLDIVLTRTWQETAGLATSGLTVVAVAAVAAAQAVARRRKRSTRPGSAPV
jgi:hypothetical protein